MNAVTPNPGLSFETMHRFARMTISGFAFTAFICVHLRIRSLLLASLEPIGIGKLGEDAAKAATPARAQHREVGIALADPMLHADPQAVARIPEDVDGKAHGNVGLHRR